LEVYFGRYAPYTYDGRSFERIESATSLMSQHRYEQLLVRRGQLNHAWEEQSAEHISVDYLDEEKIRRTIQEGVYKNRIGIEVLDYDIAHILSALKLSRDGKLINAAGGSTCCACIGIERSTGECNLTP
jgi:ATP-dependent DNA helicase RecG